MFDSSVKLMYLLKFNHFLLGFPFFLGCEKLLLLNFCSVIIPALQIRNFLRIYCLPSSNFVQWYAVAHDIDIGMGVGLRIPSWVG